MIPSTEPPKALANAAATFVVRVEKPIDCLDEMMRERQRSIEEALADLRAKYETYQTAELARMIRQLEAEIADRKQTTAGAR